MCFNKWKGNFIALIMIVISLSGWITSIYMYNDLMDYQSRVSEGKVINAYNILVSAFKRSDSEGEILLIVNDWIIKGRSAELGSLTTMCNNNPSILLGVSTAFTEALILKICKTIRSNT
ncbi:hypothetical protein AL538_04470 [Vibrio harveyi]|uniref:Uncharacterized protein n=1 Tax=Vibrio harveyi TaxID=669 RepID=A0ABN4KVF0_VIBHA|nr:hypothetical protein AL538_04470 [Vibrio harveyi]